MIAFAPLRTRRLSVHLQELPIGDEIFLCHLPESAHEKSLSEFLARAVAAADTPSTRHVSDPRAWSVGERLLALSHYCIHARDDGPNYAVTETSSLSDYLDMTKDFPLKPSTFEALDDKWVLHPLTGAAAEVLESTQGESALKGSEHWKIGAMAAQLLREGESFPDPIAEFPQYVSWLKGRILTMSKLPGSDFQVLYSHYQHALANDSQFFRIWFDGQGVVVLPKEAGAVTPPARFLVLAGISSAALSITGKA